MNFPSVTKMTDPVGLEPGTSHLSGDYCNIIVRTHTCTVDFFTYCCFRAPTGLTGPNFQN